MSTTMRRIWHSVLALAAACAVTGLLLVSSTGTALADYGTGAVYQIEISANVSGPSGGVWLWITLNANGTGDYAGSDCSHGTGAVADKGDVTWTTSGDQLIITGVWLNGLPPDFQQSGTVTVPAGYDHYNYASADNPFYKIFGLPFPGGFAQVQIAP